MLYNIMASCVKLFRLGRPDCSNPADAAEPCCTGAAATAGRAVASQRGSYRGGDPADCTSLLSSCCT